MQDNQLLLFKTIFEQTPISTQVFTPDGETILVNTAWENLWNVKFEQVKSYNILKDQQLVEAGSMHLIKRAFKGEVVHLPTIKYDPSKTVNIKGMVPYRWLHANMYPIRNSHGVITHIVLQHEDVTKRIESEEQIRRLAAIVESSDEAIISKSLDGMITSWNQGAVKMYGYTPKEVIGKHITILMPPELRTEEDEILARLRKGQHIEHFETIRMTKDKKYISVSLSISPIKDSQGTIVGASKIARDITAQKRAAEALKESEERLRIALEAGEIGVWDWDIETNTLTWTDKVFAIHGVSSHDFEVTYDNFSKLIHPDDKEEAKSQILTCIKNKVPFEAEFRIVTPKGEIRWISTRASLTLNSKGNPVRMLGATSDISRRKQIEQDKSDFLSMASHELKTPLTSMKMFIELLQRHIAKTDLEKPKYFAKRIFDQANRLTELTNDLLDVSRIETGKLRLNKEFFDFRIFIEDAVESIQTSTDEHTIVIKKNPSISIYGDRYRLYQVLVNLLTNAIKYSAPSQQIFINVKKAKQAIEVSVQDFGIGIRKDQQQKIFERLYQVSDPEEKTYPGLGLGLYISKEIIERHNGRIWVESNKGQGSTFYFSIPIQQ